MLLTKSQSPFHMELGRHCYLASVPGMVMFIFNNCLDLMLRTLNCVKDPISFFALRTRKPLEQTGVPSLFSVLNSKMSLCFGTNLSHYSHFLFGFNSLILNLFYLVEQGVLFRSYSKSFVGTSVDVRTCGWGVEEWERRGGTPRL
jgi:hypothetical protein